MAARARTSYRRRTFFSSSASWRKRKGEVRREHWRTKAGFILSSAGSAVGLGNFWRFSYLAGVSGGGVFVLTYLASVILIGIPIMIAEFLIGRKAQSSIVGAYRKLSRGKKLWGWAGLIGVFASVVIMSYYSMIGGWSISYFVSSLSGRLPQQAEGSTALFQNLIANIPLQVLWYTIFFLAVVAVVIRGIRAGIERWNRILMILFFLLLMLMVGYSLTTPGAAEAFSFLFRFDLSGVTPFIILLAVGHTFFSLSLGAGTMVAYGSYLPRNVRLPFASLVISFLDTAVAILAGLAIFPIVFSFGLSPASGTGLVFLTLPPLFSLIPWGKTLAGIFFLLLAVAAITSAISILEVVVSYLVDEWRILRPKAVFWAGGFIYLLGLTWTKYDLSLADRLAGGYLLVLGALFVSLFVGWVMKSETLAQELAWQKKGSLLAAFRFLTRYLIPALLIILLLSGVV